MIRNYLIRGIGSGALGRPLGMELTGEVREREIGTCVTVCREREKEGGRKEVGLYLARVGEKSDDWRYEKE